MAQRIITSLIDDLDGKTEASETVVFALDGKTYEIDLSKKNASKLRGALAPYVGKGRRMKARTPRGLRQTYSGNAVDAGSIRAWAKGNGYDVNDRGRVPASVREAYEKAQAA
jgi:hypothetical protein